MSGISYWKEHATVDDRCTFVPAAISMVEEGWMPIEDLSGTIDGVIAPAGTSKTPRAINRICHRLLAGRRVTLSHEAEPANPYDRNAIKLIGSWTGIFTAAKYHYGYVPREAAADLTQLILEGAKIELVPLVVWRPVVGKNGSLRLLAMKSCA